MQPITTKYFGPGNVRGARIKATSGSARSVTISYPYELNTEDAHRLAAETLCHKLGWTISLIQGSTADGYAFVFANDDALQACRLVLEWAKTPGEHGGNPYLKPFVQAARKALGDI